MVMSLMPNLYTADVDRAVAFYRDLLGGTQTFRSPDGGPAEHVELRLVHVTIACEQPRRCRRGMPAGADGRLPDGACHVVRVVR